MKLTSTCQNVIGYRGTLFPWHTEYSQNGGLLDPSAVRTETGRTFLRCDYEESHPRLTLYLQNDQIRIEIARTLTYERTVPGTKEDAERLFVLILYAWREAENGIVKILPITPSIIEAALALYAQPTFPPECESFLEGFVRAQNR